MKKSDNEPRVVLCSSFDDFSKEVRASRWGIPPIFRGQRDVKWPLSSLWERVLIDLRGANNERNVDELFGPDGVKNRNAMRDDFLRSFRHIVADLGGFGSEIRTDNRFAWAIGRHHGLVTPLLDWSLSPYVALFFAAFDHLMAANPFLTKGGNYWLSGTANVDDSPIAVWGLAYDDSIARADEFEAFSSRGMGAHRQKAQNGLFTMLTDEIALDVEAYLKSRGLAARLTRYELPGSEVPRALHNLKLMNITYDVLFPDIEGAAIATNIASYMSGFRFLYPVDDTDRKPGN